ncbi:MAG: Tat pathway signal sequence, partial [Raoultibacter sp.]
QDRTIGLFGGKTIQRVVMCDATTGEMTDLPVDEVPQWVDRVYPADLLVEQYNWSGAYSEGWINSWLGQSGVVQTTPGTNGQLGYNYIAKDDDVWVYSGITSATADNSIIGFVLVNQRTAESHFYSVAGATEDSAMRSAEGQVQHLGYSATFPLLINISGQPTYFMALKDNAGLVKMFAMLDIQRYQNVAVGNTVEECQQAYKALLATNGVELADEGATSITTEAEGTIERIVTAVVDGNSHFYVKLAQDDKLYDFALPRMLAIVGYAEGDAIKFTYLDGDGICPAEEILEPKVSVDPNALIPASDEKQASGAPEAAVGNQAAGSDAQAGATQ